jgi:hypothetical protein
VLPEALVALAAAPAWPEAPRPVPSSALLAERATLGEERARSRLLAEVHAPLAAAGGDLLETAAVYLDEGGAVESTARRLFLHPNTVRYRLRRIASVVGLDLSKPRDAQVVRLALVLGRVAAQPSSSASRSAESPTDSGGSPRSRSHARTSVAVVTSGVADMPAS